MVCMELFDEQPSSYKESVFPKGVPVMSIEAMSTYGWQRYAHVTCRLNQFGASAPASQVYSKFGLVPDVLAAKAVKVVAYYKENALDWRIRLVF